jgi:hypothetical protein
MIEQEARSVNLNAACERAQPDSPEPIRRIHSGRQRIASAGWDCLPFSSLFMYVTVDSIPRYTPYILGT